MAVILLKHTLTRLGPTVAYQITCHQSSEVVHPAVCKFCRRVLRIRDALSGTASYLSPGPGGAEMRIETRSKRGSEQKPETHEYVFSKE